jgi:hypothetical protein
VSASNLISLGIGSPASIGKFVTFGLGAAAAVTVPNVVGETQAQGTTDIQAVGLTVSIVTAYSSVVAAGLIISQVPAGGSQVSPGSDVQITVSLGEQLSTGAGRSHRRRYYIDIDGQTFPVDSAEHARALLERAREIAASHAREIAEKVAPRSRKVGKKPIPLPTPHISSPDAELTEIISAARNAINDLYRTAAIEAEIAFLLRKAAEDDEDDALMLLM